jgi:hypothetical protein
MKRYIKLYSILAACWFAGTTAFAQDTKPPVKTETEAGQYSEAIEIVRPYKPVLAEALKLRRSPDLKNLKPYKSLPKYLLYDQKLDANTDIQKLEAQKLAAIEPSTLSNNYVKGGIGNLGTFLAEAYVAMGKDPALQTGFFFNHINQQGKLLKQNENRQQLSAFARSIGEKNTFNAKINYQRHGLNFYGFNPDTAFIPAADKQTYNLYEAEVEAISKFTPDPDAFSYAAKVNGYIFNDRYQANEKSLSISGFLNKRIRNFNLGVASSIDFGHTKDSIRNNANNLFKLNPYLKIQAGGVKIIAGANLVSEFGSKSSSRIFPLITADFTLIEDYLQIFAELKGDVYRSTLRSFADENPFLNQNILVKNQVEKLSISGGIKGTGGPGFGYKARIFQKEISDMPLFVNNFSKFNKFDVIYDFYSTRILGLEGELSVQVSDNLKWTGKLLLQDYKAGAERESFFKPQLQLSSNLVFVYNKKVTFEAAVAIQDDSRAKVYLINQQDLAGNYPSIPDYSKEKIVTVKGFVDLGLGASYKINPSFSVFARANNTLNSNYSKFLYYRLNGFNIFGGLSYSF